MYFWKIWGLIEKLLSESFDSQSKYFNFWVRNANWKYWFGFYHHQTYLSICRNPILTSETVIRIKKVYDIKTLYLPFIIMMILWWCRKDIRYHDFKVYGLLFWKITKRKVVFFWNIVPRAILKASENNLNNFLFNDHSDPSIINKKQRVQFSGKLQPKDWTPKLNQSNTFRKPTDIF